MNTRTVGTHYEDIARQFLEKQGLTFVATHISCSDGEIDLIMKEVCAWVFIEVRYRKNARFGDAAATVLRSKQKKVYLAAMYWLNQQRIDVEQVEIRFDVVAITGKDIQWIPHAFSALELT